MKTLRDTNNNNSNITNNTTQQHFSLPISSTSPRQNLITSNGSLHPNSTIIDSDAAATYPSLLTQNRLQQQTIWRTNNAYRNTLDQPSSNSNPQQIPSAKLPTQNNNNPFASMLNGDTNQLSSIIQTYLTKFGGNQMFQSDPINPLLYLQLMNANTMFMQQLSTMQNNTFSSQYDPIKHQQIPTSNIDIPIEPINSKRTSQVLQVDSNIFVPKTRSMTQDEIAEHARLVYQRALQRNQLQQHNDLMKHFYETLNTKQQDPTKSTDHNEVPSVPNASNITSMSTFDVLDTVITSPSSCLSIKEASIDAALSSLSLVSVDDTKMRSNTGSILDPSAPVFIPRQNRAKLDDDNETSSSSSVSDFNDFHYLDQFLDEFYNSDNEHDNHLIIHKSSSSQLYSNNNNNNKYTINHNILGQGDAIEQLPCETTAEIIEQPLSTTEKQECQYSIYELFDRYRNPRCHLVLPEWSRLSLILPNVCSMRSHTYKIKRYFAYRRRLHEDQNPNKDLNLSTTNISVQG